MSERARRGDLLSRLAFRRYNLDGVRRWLIVNGWRRGMSGSRPWLYVGGAVTAAQVLRRLLAEPEARAVFEVRPGDAFEIRTVDPPGR